MKVMFRELPSRIQCSIDSIEPIRRRRIRRLHPEMVDEMTHMIGGDPKDPIGIMLIASLVRDDFPWLYEIGMETYRACKSGDASAAKESLKRFQRIAEFTMRGGFLEDSGLVSEESHMMMRELHMLIDYMIPRFVEGRAKRLPESNE